MSSRRLYGLIGLILLASVSLWVAYFVLIGASMGGYKLSFGSNWVPSMAPRTSHDRERIEFDGVCAEYNLYGVGNESQELLEIDFGGNNSREVVLKLNSFPDLDLNKLTLTTLDAWPGSVVIRKSGTFDEYQTKSGLGSIFHFDQSGNLKKAIFLGDSPANVYWIDNGQPKQLWNCTRREIVEILGPPTLRKAVGVEAAPNH